MTLKTLTPMAAAIAMAVALTAGFGAPAGAQTGTTGTPKVVGEPGATGPTLPVEQIIAKITAAGLTDITLIELEHDRYEVKCRDAKGQPVEAFVDRKTGEVVRDPKTGKPVLHKVTTVGLPSPGIPAKDLAAKAMAEGMREVFAIEFEHALYEIKAIDAQGRKVELYAHPKTGELLRHPKTGKPMMEFID